VKIATINDTHFGGRNDSAAFNEYFFKFYDKVFFPYLREHNIKTLVHLGDVVDRRKFINFNTLQSLREKFIHRLGKEEIDTHIIIGNHDTYYKNTNDVNSMTELFSSFDGKHEPWIYADPTELVFDGLKILILPWINDGNRKETYELIEKSDAPIIMGHLEVAGFQMHPGYSNEHGIDAAMFNRFDMVMSGHYHHKSDNGTIYYLGAPYEITWTDYQDPRGFHVFDTDTRELEYIRNPYKMFHKIFYDDEGKTFEEVTGKDFSSYAGSCIKVVVQSKTNPYWFDIMLDKLYKVNPMSVSIVEDFTDITSIGDAALIDQAEDTMTILNNYIDTIEIAGDKKQLQDLLQDLHKDALNMDLE
jgi:DNA repair exonuclease SbcCD nuclease subunit